MSANRVCVNTIPIFFNICFLSDEFYFGQFLFPPVSFAPMNSYFMIFSKQTSVLLALIPFNKMNALQFCHLLFILNLFYSSPDIADNLIKCSLLPFWSISASIIVASFKLSTLDTLYVICIIFFLDLEVISFLKKIFKTHWEWENDIKKR